MNGEGSSQRAFTAVRCTGENCAEPAGVPVAAEVGLTVRQCPHAVLAAAPCPFPVGRCPRRGPSGLVGPVLVVQPVQAPDRRPVAPAIIIGPVATWTDLRSVCMWLRRGRLSIAALPSHLVTTLSRQGERLPGQAHVHLN